LELIELTTTIRETRGNGAARRLRREGKLPAVLYGPDTDAMALTVEAKDLESAIKESRGSQVILNLAVNGEEKRRMVMLKELQTDPVSREMIHADFFEISMDRKIRIMVPVIAIGKSKGIEMGGMLQIIRRDLEVMCYPHEIPKSIEIDITELDLGESVHIEDIPVQGDVEFPHDVNFTVLTIVSGRMKAASEEEEADAEVEGEEEEAEEAEEAETGEA
jgi:large subunit ribosomal protein L25